MDSSPQVAKLAQNSEINQKIQKMRTLAKSKQRGSDPVPLSKFKYETMKRPQHRVKTVMTPSTFNRKYSKDLTKDQAMRDRLKSIVTRAPSQDKPLTDNEGSHSIHTICPVKCDAIDSKDPEKSESYEFDDIDELDISDNESQDNAPADRLAGDESGPKEDETGDAEGKVRDVVV
jgi:hypothetical protein